jgi:hypothetical protein
MMLRAPVAPAAQTLQCRRRGMSRTSVKKKALPREFALMPEP